jgi:hypothetical protein
MASMKSNTSPQPLSRRAKVIGTLILIVGGIAAGLLLIALLIRLFPNLEPGGQRFMFTELDGDTFRHQPGQVRPPDENRVLEQGVRHDDADGFRRPARTADRYPIAVIGDSFTDGGQVPWTDMLAETLDTPVRNLGWSGFGPLEYAEIAERFLADDHEWVLVAYFEGNDLSNIRTSRQRAYENGGELPLNLTHAYGAPVTDVRQLDQYTDITLDPQERYLYPLTHIRPDGSTFEMAYISDYLWWLNGEIGTYAGSRNAGELADALGRIEAAADGACVALVYIPNKEHVYFRYADPEGNRKFVLENGRELIVGEDGWLTHGPVAPVDYEAFEARMDNQRAAVMQIADAAGFQFIDLLDPFVSDESNTAYYTYDSHWNETGHRLTADTVAEYIRGNPCTEKPS